MSNNSYVMPRFNMATFLEQYWQKKPCMIKGFFEHFEDPIDEHELAGLAQEEEVDSRLVSLHQNQWKVTQGPIDDFTELCVGAWSLLVQGVDRYVPEVDAMFAKVSRIGHWRMDDVMVSFSTPDAGVGAHIDQYDVFIVQGKGSRRWRVGLPTQHETVLPHPLLSQIAEFEAVIDQSLDQGDAIYIPPLHPHSGTTISPCLNYSIGFRAPTNVELLNGLLDEGENLQLSQTRYTDPDCAQYRTENTRAQVVTKAEMARIKRSLVDLLNTPEAEQALLRFISRQNLPDGSPEIAFELDEVLDIIESDCNLVLLPGVKAIYGEQETEDFIFYIDGEPFSVQKDIKAITCALLLEAKLSLPLMLNNSQTNQLALLLMHLLNAGYVEVQPSDI